MPTHRIHTQRLLLEAPDLPATAAAGWYERLERMQDSVLLPALNRALDRIDTDGAERRLERLEITLEVAGTERLETLVAQQIDAALATALGELPTPGGDLPTVARRKPSVDLLCYLRTGALPWPHADSRSFATDLIDELPRLQPADWQRIRHFALEEPTRFFGRAAILPSAFWRGLRRAMNERNSGSAPILNGREPAVPTTEEERRWWLDLFRADGTRTTDAAAVRVRRGENSPPAADPVADETKTVYYVDNAGLVLLHPFLPGLLGNVGCLDAEGRVSDLARAAALLHYCVSGRTDCEEWQLPLTKLLLGLDPAELLTPASELTTTDRAAADELLRAVLDHWGKLGSTGTDGLRGNFLYRPGRLESLAGGWQLTVERRAFDVLLDGLPWGIGMITNRWMEGRLITVWR